MQIEKQLTAYKRNLVDAVQTLLDLDPLGKGTSVGLVVAGDAVRQQATVLAHRLIVGRVPLGEAPLSADGNLLPAGELELGSTQGLDDVLLVGLLHAHGKDHLTDVDAGDGAQWLAKGAAHSRLQSIGSGAGQHLVDAQHVEGMHADTDVEGVLAASFHLEKEEGNDVSDQLHRLSNRLVCSVMRVGIRERLPLPFFTTL